MTGVNDTVAAWGRTRGIDYYDEAKKVLLDGRTDERFYAEAGSYGTMNDAMIRMAGPSAMGDAVLWLDSAVARTGEPRVPNLGAGDTTGVSGAVIYDGAAVLPGLGNNYLSVPDEAALDITGDIDLRCHCAPTDWTPAANQTFFSKYANTGNQRGYMLWLLTDGTVRLYWSEDGGAAQSKTSTVAASTVFADGEAGWVRATLDVDNGASGFDVKFYTSADGETWTQLGATVTTAGTTSIFNSSAGLQIGVYEANLARFAGDVRRTIVKNGIDGTTVLDVDLTNVPNWTGPTFEATTGQTVTVNTTATDYGAPSGLDAKYGSVLGAYVHDGAAVLPGATGNYLSVPDSSALDITGDIDFRFRVKLNDWSPGTRNALISKRDVASNFSYWFALNTGTSNGFVFSWTEDGSTGLEVGTGSSDLTDDLVDGETVWVRFAVDVDNGASQLEWSAWVLPDQPEEPTWGTAHKTGTRSGATSFFSGTSDVWFGEYSSAFLDGAIYRAIVKDGIDGTTVLDVNVADAADYAGSFTATTGQTVTVNSTSSDTNDPLLLTHTGDNYAYQPSAANNALTFPVGSYLDFVGDMEFVVRVNLSDWRNVGTGAFVNRNSGGIGWAFQHVDGYWTINFGATSFYSTVRFVEDDSLDGTTWWIKATFDQDSGGGNSTARFYYAADQSAEPTSWTQLGADVVSTAPTRTNPVTNMAVGKFVSLAAAPQDMDFYRVIVRNGIGGTSAVDFNAATDMTDAGATSFTATSGQTVTVNRATAGRKTTLVTRPVWLLGTDDYLEVADNDLLDINGNDLSLLVVARQFATVSALDEVIVTKNSSIYGVSTAGYALYSRGGATSANFFRVSDGTTNVNDQSPGFTLGDLQALYGIYESGVEVSSGINAAGPSPETDTTTGDFRNSQVFRVGATLGGGGYYDGEIVAVAVWRRVLTADEIAEINSYYGTV